MVLFHTEEYSIYKIYIFYSSIPVTYVATALPLSD